MENIKVDEQMELAVAMAATLSLRYAGMKITSHDGYVAASNVLKDIKERGRKLEELRRSMTKPLDDSKAKIMGFFRAPAEDLAAAEKAVKSAMLRFSQEQERERFAEAEQGRRLRRVEQERVEAEMLAAAEEGRIDEVEVMYAAQEAAKAIPVPIPPSLSKVVGIGSRKVWKWRMVDYALVPREYLKLDEVVIGTAVRVGQGATVIPGIEVYCEEIVTSRGM